LASWGSATKLAGTALVPVTCIRNSPGKGRAGAWLPRSGAALVFRHRVCPISAENLAFLTAFCENDRGTQRVDFDRGVKLEFRGSTVTSDAGLLASAFRSGRNGTRRAFGALACLLIGIDLLVHS
jgi:hypothetical protein